jgi:hypothetical protein
MRSSTIIIILFFIGCSTTYKVAVDPSNMKGKVLSYKEVQEKIHTERVEIFCTGNKLIQAERIIISNDSVSFINTSDNIVTNLPLSSIVTIRRRLYSDGATEGFFFGSLTGCTLGIGLIALKEDKNDRSVFRPLAYGFGGMIIGCTAGTTWGAIHGHTVEYQFVGDSILTKEYAP